MITLQFEYVRLTMQSRRPGLIQIFLFLPFFLMVAANAYAERVPASFGDQGAERWLGSLIKFPEIEGKVSVMLNCISRVQTNGKMRESGCYVENQFDTPFAAAVQKAAKKARMTPAVIDGKKREIYLQFRVEFIQDDDQREILLYLNPAEPENLQEYGMHHIAAQRTIGKEAWMKVCPQRAGFVIVARAHVSMEGVGSNVSLHHGAGIVPTGPCQQAIIDAILTSDFAPTTVDGVAVPSTFVEPFGN